MSQCRDRTQERLDFKSAQVSNESQLYRAKLTRKIEIVLILLVQHGSRDVRNVSPGIAFARHVNLEFFYPENVLEVLEEAKKVCGDVFFARCCHIPEGKPSSNWLFDPKDHQLAFSQKVLL